MWARQSILPSAVTERYQENKEHECCLCRTVHTSFIEQSSAHTWIAKNTCSVLCQAAGTVLYLVATDTVKTIGTLCNGCRPRIARPEFGLPFCPCQQFYHLEAKKEYEIDEERENNRREGMGRDSWGGGGGGRRKSNGTKTGKSKE